jgi:hypothetical protein
MTRWIFMAQYYFEVLKKCFVILINDKISHSTTFRYP